MSFHSEIIIVILLTQTTLFSTASFAIQEKAIGCRGVVHVTPSLNNWNYNCRCFPLHECLCNSSYSRRLSNTTMLLSSNVTHYFQYPSPCTVRNIENLNIKGEVSGTNQAKIDCNNTETKKRTVTGVVRNIIFINVTQLTISNINIINCGSEIPSNILKSVRQSFFYIEQEQKAVVLIAQSRSVTLMNMNIQRYKGFAIFFVNVFNLIRIEAVSIGNTSCFGRKNISCSFGAFVAYFYNPLIPLNKTDNSINIFMNDLSFTNNINTYHPNDTCYTDAFHSAKKFPMITSAALTMFFCQSTFIINVNIENTTFEKNYGQVAAGILIVYRNSPSTAFVVLNNIFFYRNYFLDIRDPCVGTSIRAVFHQTMNNIYKHGNSPHILFLKDTRVSSHQNQSSVYISGLITSNVDLYFNNFTCIDNAALNNGICMTVEILRHSESFASGSNLKVLFSDVNASCNKYWYQQFDQHALVPSAKTLLKNPSLFTFINIQLVIFDGISSFFKNGVTAISTFNSDVKLKGEVRFQNNELHLSRGILYLATLSHLIFGENVKVEFIHNRVMFTDSALINGFSTTSYTHDTNCAFQFESIDKISNVVDAINITFKNNSFARSNQIGELITITPAYHCVQIYSSKKHYDMAKVYNKVFHSSTTMVRSMPIKVCACKNITSFTCTGIIPNTSNVHVYPGTRVTIHVAITDEGDKIVPATILAQVKFNDTRHSELLFNPHTYIDEFYHYNRCANFNYMINTRSADIKNPFLLISVLHEQPTLKVNFAIQQCPIGFELQNGVCDCNKFIKTIKKITSNVEIMCNLSIESNTTYAIVRTTNVWFWLGKGNEITTRMKSSKTKQYTHSLIYSGICPLGNCNYLKSSVNLFLNDSLCTAQRTGQLCSECKPGYSIVFGSKQCYICTNYWLLTIVLYAFLGLLLVVFLSLLRFTIDHGIVTSLILYSNIATFGLMDLVGVNPNYIKFESIFLSLINLNIGYPICFYNGMTETVKIALQFVFPVYVWVIVIFTILVSRRSVVISNWISNRSVQVLMTLIHLSYVKLLVNVINIFSFLKVFVEDYSEHNVQIAYLWYSDASIPYGSTWGHVCLIIVAVMFTCGFLIPYLLFSLFTPCCWRWKLIIRLRPVFDTLYGPYKHKYAYWFGVRLLLLTIFAVIFANTQGVNVYDQLLSYLILLILFVIAQSWIQPFKNKLVNLIDTYHIINMTFLYCFYLFFILKHELAEDYTNWFARLGVGSILLLFFAGFIYHSFQYIPIVHSRLMSINKLLPNPVYLLLLKIKTKLSSDRFGYRISVQNSNSVLREPLIESASSRYYN